MNKLLFTASVLTLITFGCVSDNSIKEKELELRERELELKEKELEEKQSFEQENTYQQRQQPTSEKTISNASEGELKESLYSKESRSPLSYLSAKYTYKVNLLANTIIEGKIINSATTAGFKNVEMTVSFLSKTGVVLGRETFTVMEFVPANSSVNFRHKITGWWDKVSYTEATIDYAEAY